MNQNFLYFEQGKAILYTTSAPKLFENGAATELLMLVKTDERDDGLFRIIVTFFKVTRIGEPKLTLRFRFKISNGNWSLTSVKVEDSKKLEEFYVIGKPITAPLQFSYKCAQTLVFRSNSTSPLKLNLTLTNVQVQPLMDGSSQFGDAYDCVGFTTAPICSGIVVISFVLAIIMLGLLCILEIRTPNKFENNRGKQLRFTVQE